MDLTVTAAPGPIAPFGEATINGPQTFDPAIVRSFLYIHPGDPYSPAAIADARNSIRQIPAVGGVRITEGTALDPYGRLPYQIDVEDRLPYSVGASVKYSTTNGPEGQVYWEDRNVFGGAERLRLQASVFYAPPWFVASQSLRDFSADDIGGRISASFLKPALWGTTNDLANLTGRSHFFDLQFVHGMALEEREPAYVTLSKILLWAEITYRLSVGDGLTGTERLSDVPITSTVTDPAGVAHSAKLSQFFGSATRPRGDATLRYLLTQDSKFVNLDLGRRAIGSLLHLVQDSYALGHTRRTLLNPQDRVPGTKDQFKPGTWGRYGEVENFHCYRGQDHELHAKYDEIDASTVDIDDLDTFNPLIGARDSVEMSGRLLALWRAQTRWDAADGPKDLLTNTIFKLSPNVTPADTKVLDDK